VIRRGRFRRLISTQLDLFEAEHAELLEACTAARAAYADADREDAQERYVEFADLLETAADGLEEMRDTYARSLDEQAAAEYTTAFDRVVERRFPEIAPHLG